MNPRAQKKKLEIFCGPNGAGKSTLADLLRKKRGKINLINADIIAAGLNASYDNLTAIDSGKIMLKQINDYIKKRKSFAFETTLSGKIRKNIINKAQDAGYLVILYFVTLHDTELAIKRVKDRVSIGGHDIPEATVRRRFQRSHLMFHSIYKNISDTWYVFDNTNSKTVPVANGGKGFQNIVDNHLYDTFLLKAKPN